MRGWRSDFGRADVERRRALAILRSGQRQLANGDCDVSALKANGSVYRSPMVVTAGFICFASFQTVRERARHWRRAAICPSTFGEEIE